VIFHVTVTCWRKKEKSGCSGNRAHSPLAARIAEHAGVKKHAVGYAGLKDRHAVTRQWFSLPLAEGAPERPERLDIEGVTVLEVRRHTRKLKRGTLDGNRFRLVIREFSGDAAETTRRLEQISTHGVPNYFGPQRFGRGGGNVRQGLEKLRDNARLPRHKKSIFLSALRSFLFNHVLAERVRRGGWNRIMEGELAMLDGTHSIFPCDEPDE
jgi:tRNA pseudouridine13 synthase